jgi:hypothetical protein
MTRNVLITAQTEKAVCVGARTWIARSQIVELVELDALSQAVDCGGVQRVGIPHAIVVTEKAAARAGW